MVYAAPVSYTHLKDYSFDTIGEYTIYFTATKDGYTVQSTEKKLTVTKPNLSNAEITFPYGNEAAFNSVTATGVPTFVVTYKGTELKENVDFVITRGASTYDCLLYTSLRCAVENDVFASLPQDSLLDELEMGWEDEQ